MLTREAGGASRGPRESSLVMTALVHRQVIDRSTYNEQVGQGSTEDDRG